MCAMYKPRKYLRLDSINHFPRLDDAKRLASEAYKARGCSIELPWHSSKSDLVYILTVLVELGGHEAVWALYQGEDETSTVLWSTAFNDLEMLMDVMTLSLPEEVESSQIPPELAVGQRPPAPLTAPFHNYPPGYLPSPGYPPNYQYPYPPGYTPAAGYYPPQYLPAPYPAPQHPPGQYLPSQYLPGQYPPTGYPQQPGAPRDPRGGAPSPMPAPHPMPAPQPVPVVMPDSSQAAGPSAMAASNAVPVASTVPVRPGAPPDLSSESVLPPVPVKSDSDRLKKRSNIMLGQFLVQADLIPLITLDSALLLQEMVKNGVFDIDQASEALVRAHNRGGALEAAAFTAKPTNIERVQNTPPLGQLLLKAGLIDGNALTAALRFQDAARTGVLEKNEALEGFVQETFGKSRPDQKDGPEVERTIKLLTQANLLSEQDVQVARKLQEKHGGELIRILVTAGKIESKTLEAAAKIQFLVARRRLKSEQAVIALDFCHRIQVTFDEAIAELGWPKP